MQTFTTSSEINEARAASAMNLAGAFSSQSSHDASSSRDDLDFSRMMADYMEASPAEITPTLDVNTDLQQGEPLLAATDPYAGQNDAASSFVDVSALETAASVPASDIRLTEKEVRQIADNLRKAGVDEESVKRVEELAGHPGGASVSEVARALAKEEPAKLTEGDLVRIEALAGELDPTGALGQSVLANLRNGQVTQAWTSLNNALNNLEAGSSVTLDRQGVLALGKAMRLSRETLDALDKSFGGKSELTLTVEGAKTLLVPAQKEVVDKSAAQQKLAFALEDAMKPVIRDARKRLELEAQAGGRTNRRTEQSQALIRDTVTRNGFERQGGTAAEQAAAATQKQAAGTAGEPAKTDGSGARTSDAKAVDARTADAKTAAEMKAPPEKSGEAGPKSGQNGVKSEVGAGPAGNEATARLGEQAGQKGQGGADPRLGQDSAGKDSAGKEAADKGFGLNAAEESGKAAGRAGRVETPANPWDSLLNRLDSASIAASPMQGAGQTSSLAAATAAAAKARAASTPSAHVLSQVEKGMFSALTDGTKRLELQLNPLDLGSVTVLLSTRNGEVSALMRPERPETAALLMQQLGDLRADLEQQGLKVDRVDVQTQLKDGQGTTWQGMDQHNSAQEQQNRSNDLERQRRLSRNASGRGERDLSGAVPVSGVDLGGSSYRPGSSAGLHLVA